MCVYICVCVCSCMCACVCMCVCVCVYVYRLGQYAGSLKFLQFIGFAVSEQNNTSVLLLNASNYYAEIIRRAKSILRCVCVCVRERERERERGTYAQTHAYTRAD